MEASWDQNGDIDRASFLAEIVDGKQKIVETLPKLKPSKADCLNLNREAIRLVGSAASIVDSGR
jgi:hypothetical protein